VTPRAGASGRAWRLLEAGLRMAAVKAGRVCFGVLEEVLVCLNQIPGAQTL
jgi:hypothetical protein